MDVHAIATGFVTARRLAQGLTTYPGELPTDLDTAYQIQDTAMELRGGDVAGWKAGLIAPALRSPGGDERLVGPIWADTVHVAADGLEMAVHGEGFAAVEGEFLIRIDADLAPRSWTADEAADLPHTVHAGIEIASSPYAEINDHGPAVTASDFGNNQGIVIGAELNRAGLNAQHVRTEIDGVVVGEATGAAIPGGIHTSLAQTLTILGRRGRWAAAGSWFATGAVTGVHRAHVGQTASVTFTGLPPMTVKLVASVGA